MGAGGHFWKARMIDFIALSANAHNQEKQKDWKYKMDPFWGRGIGVFLTVGEKIAPGRNVFQNSVLSFLNIGNYGLC